MTNKPRDFMPHESDNSYIAVEYRKLKAENDALKESVDQLKNEIRKWNELYILTSKQCDRTEKKRDTLKRQLEIAVKACQLYEQAFDDTGNDYSHLVCLEEAQKLLEQIQKMLRKNEGDEQW